MELIIETLEDVLPHVVPDTGIIHSDHGGYSVINYVFSIDNTFDTPMARECRGLKFDPEGKLMARPFHKFFNLGEKRPPQEEPWHESHLVLDKLDGSMVHPATVGDEMVFMTRMGVSAQARQALSLASPELRALCRDMMAAGFTPIFEFTSPENRVVLAYEQPELTLLAIRHMRTGAYMPHHEVASIAVTHGVAMVGSSGVVEDVSAFWTNARTLEGIEGYVIAFDDGHRLKIKTDAYALRHKALAGLEFEKNLLAWVATDAIDDVVPLLSAEAADVVLSYQSQVIAAVSKWEAEIGGFVAENGHLPRKDFALKAKDQIDPRLQSVAFRALDGIPIRKGLMEILERASGSENKIDAVRHLFDMKWTAPKAIE
ncbi:MAG: RNA ligase [Stappiaceae bacterium]